MSVTPNVGTVSQDGENCCAVHELVFDGLLDRKEIQFFGNSKTVTVGEIKRYLVWVEKQLEAGGRYVLEMPDKRISVKYFVITSNFPGLYAYQVISDFEEARK